MTPRPPISLLVAWGAVLCSALYWVSDLIETLQAGFSTGQLWLTLVAEAAIPVVLLGLYVLQRDALGVGGRAALAAYAVVYTGFAATVVYALVDGTPDFDALSEALDPWMTVGGAVMVLAGVALAVAEVRACAVPRWAGALFAAGVVLVALSAGMSDGVQLLASGLRDAGFAAVCFLAALSGAARGASPGRAAEGVGVPGR